MKWFMVAQDVSLCGSDATLGTKNFTFSLKEPRPGTLIGLQFVFSLGVAALLVIFHVCCHSFNFGSTLDKLSGFVQLAFASSANPLNMFNSHSPERIERVGDAGHCHVAPIA